MKRATNCLKTKRTGQTPWFQLLMEQPFDQVSTVKLAEKAGISRSGFILITKISMI